jgi:hypothetical protein
MKDWRLFDAHQTVQMSLVVDKGYGNWGFITSQDSKNSSN